LHHKYINFVEIGKGNLYKKNWFVSKTAPPS